MAGTITLRTSLTRHQSIKRAAYDAETSANQWIEDLVVTELKRLNLPTEETETGAAIPPAAATITPAAEHPSVPATAAPESQPSGGST